MRTLLLAVVQGVQLYFHQQAIDTTTPSGTLMFGVFSSFAEFERDLIRERIKLGVERARKEGKKLEAIVLRQYKPRT